MKNIEAAWIIEGIEEVHGTLPENGLLVEEALRMAVEALHKREPKAYELRPVKVADDGIILHDRFCPSCGHRISEVDFCPNCGQAIEWG